MNSYLNKVSMKSIEKGNLLDSDRRPISRNLKKNHKNNIGMSLPLIKPT